MSTPSSRPITTTSLARVLLMAAISLCLAACGPADPLEEARELQSAGQFEESLPILQELVAARPDLSEASYRHGVALNRTGKPELAVWALRQAATDETWAVQAGIELAAGALQVGNYQSALEATNHVLEVDPENAQALFLRAEAYLGEKTQPELALEDLERVLEKTPDNLPALSSRAAALIMLDRIDDAEAAIRDLEARALVLPPEKAGPGVSLGRLCITRALFENDRGNFEAAQEGLESCLETHPADRVVVQEAMTFFDSRGEQDRATEILTTALETQPNAHHYRRALGERLRAVGQVQEAEELLRAGVGIGGPSQRSGAWLAIADHFIALDELDPAADAFAKALALNPDPPVAAMLEYADLLARAKRYDEALEVASKFESDAYRGLIEARIHYDNDRPAEALARLEEVFVTWPNNAGARYYAARSAEQLGDFERAIAEYRQALRSGAGLTEAGLRLGKLHRGRGEFEAAFTAVNHYFSAQPRDEDAVAFLVRMTGRVGGPDRLRLLFLQLQGSEHYPRALAIQANLVAEREGHQAAIARVRLAEKSGLDLYHKRSAPMLRALVNHLGALERHDEASAALERSLSTDPERADYHEILARR
jgi:tetratricopeptide (TPR) repeat protein